jgi:hypothetical protein
MKPFSDEFTAKLEAIIKGWAEDKDGGKFMAALEAAYERAQAPDASPGTVETAAVLHWLGRHHAEHHERETMLLMMLDAAAEEVLKVRKGHKPEAHTIN